jgi:HNH endonuclease
MSFSTDVKARMFARCMRHCCLCRKQCGTNIEAAHIIDKAEGGSNDEENGIPLCFDCHQEIGAYRDSHPKGNKFSPDELRSRRDKVYELVESGQIRPEPTKSSAAQTNAAVLIQGPNAINISGPNAVVLGPNAITIVGPIVHNDGK